MDETTTKTTVATLLAQLDPEPRPGYIPTRYPYTYAYDFLRCHQQLAPAEAFERADAKRHPDDPPIRQDAMCSRGDAVLVVREWAAMEGRADDELCLVLADAYLIHHGIRPTLADRHAQATA